MNFIRSDILRIVDPLRFSKFSTISSFPFVISAKKQKNQTILLDILGKWTNKSRNIKKKERFDSFANKG